MDNSSSSNRISGNNGNHRLSMNNRGNLVITGIVDVISFNLEEVLLESICGMILIKGKELKVGSISLDSGQVDVDGIINSIEYSEVSSFGKKSKSILKRLFA